MGNFSRCERQETDLQPAAQLFADSGKSSAITAAGDALNEWLVFARLPTVTWPSQRTTALTKGERRQRAQSGQWSKMEAAVGAEHPDFGSSHSIFHPAISA